MEIPVRDDDVQRSDTMGLVASEPFLSFVNDIRDV